MQRYTLFRCVLITPIFFLNLVPDWLTKAATILLINIRCKLTTAAFGRQAALRIDFIAGAETEDFEDLGETRAGTHNTKS